MIDFTDPALDLVYLVSLSYSVNGEAHTARWCGPPNRTGGGGLVAKDPATGVSEQWESRLTNGRVLYDLGGLTEGLARVAVASFTVQAGGPDSLELRKAVRDGRWINRTAQVWAYDRNDATIQHLGDGVVSREPTGWGDSSFQIAIRIWPFPDSLEFPTDAIPLSIPATWDATNNPLVPAANIWHPSNGAAESYQMNPAHFGKRLGRLFGGSNLYDQGVFVELVPYGMQTQTEDYIFCWVSSVELCFVRDVWWEADDGVINPSADGQSPIEIRPFINRDATRGPLGTCVKIRMDSFAASSKPRWWAPDVAHSLQGEGAQHRIFGMAVGPGYADFPSGFDEVTDPFLTPTWFNADTVVPAAVSPWRGRYNLILEDLNAAPWLNAFSPYFGTNAIVDFVAAAPTNFVNGYKCRIPNDLSDSPPAMRSVLSEFMAALQADLCWRLDTVTERMAMFPIWRGPRPTAVADWTFKDHDLIRVEQPRSIRWEEDPFRDYGTRLEIRSPGHSVRPGAQIESKRKILGSFINTPEEQPDQYNGELLKKIARSHWINTGATTSARNAGEHHGQRQRASVATLGAPAFRVQLGDLLEYNIGDYPTAIGQVRRVSLNLDAVTATITALHIEAFPDDGGKGKGEEE